MPGYLPNSRGEYLFYRSHPLEYRYGFQYHIGMRSWISANDARKRWLLEADIRDITQLARDELLEKLLRIRTKVAQRLGPVRTYLKHELESCEWKCIDQYTQEQKAFHRWLWAVEDRIYDLDNQHAQIMLDFDERAIEQLDALVRETPWAYDEEFRYHTVRKLLFSTFVKLPN